MKTKKRKKKKTVKQLNWWEKTKQNLLGAWNCAKDAFLNVVRKTWNMLLDCGCGPAWGAIVFGVLTLLNVLNPWDLLALIAIFLGVRHLWDDRHFH